MADPGFMDRGADILLPPPAPPLLLSSLLLLLIPLLFFLDVQARRGASAPPAPTLDPPLALRDRCWTAERRIRHNLQDSDICIICAQSLNPLLTYRSAVLSQEKCGFESYFG